MKAIIFRRHGGAEQLNFEDVAVPEPRADEVLVQVRTVALNGFDPMVLNGIPTLKTPLPMTPCSDCAGVVVRLGDAVDQTRWHTGQRVSVVPLRPGRGMVGETLPGVASQYCVAPESALIPLPDGVSDIDAAALPTAYGTALRMCVTRARIKPGERVLILGASGGVGIACVQLARALGADVTAGVTSDAARPLLTALGVDAIINTSGQDLYAEVLQRFGKPSIWGGGGVDVVINAVGGDTWGRSLACLGRGGRLVTCGASAGADVLMDLRYVWSFEIEILGSNGWTLADQQDLIERVAAGRLKPVIHTVRPLAEMRDAIKELMAQRVVGKSILEVPVEAA